MRRENESVSAFLHRIQPPFGDVKLPATLKVSHLAKPESRILLPLLPERAKRKLGMFVTSRAFGVFRQSTALIWIRMRYQFYMALGKRPQVFDRMIQVEDSGQRHQPWAAGRQALALTMSDSRSHSSFLATDFAPTLTRLLRAHEPVISPRKA